MAILECMKSAILLVPLFGILVVGLAFSRFADVSGMPGYAGDDSELSLAEDAEAARSRLDAVLEGVTRTGTELELTEKELRDVVLIGLARHEQGQRVLEMSTGLSTRVVGGKLEVAVRIDVQSILDDLTAEERRFFDSAVGLAPMLEKREVVIAFEAIPDADRGLLSMDPGATSAAVSIVKLPVRVFLERMGTPRRDVERLFRYKIPGYRLDEMQVEGDALRTLVRKS